MAMTEKGDLEGHATKDDSRGEQASDSTRWNPGGIGNTGKSEQRIGPTWNPGDTGNTGESGPDPDITWNPSGTGNTGESGQDSGATWNPGATGNTGKSAQDAGGSQGEPRSDDAPPNRPRAR
jgi:hypothetical protein